ncbi:MAG: HlyD family secretion protein [Desulfitobacteriaceae bacterium]
MKNKKKVLVILLIAILAVAGGIVFYYEYENANYISTDDARIAANIVNVSPQIPGRVTAWNVVEGDKVQAGGNLGWQDTNAVATSAGVNASALNLVGGLTVSKAEIVAPISGEVIKAAVIPGQMVSPGQTLALIADMSDFFVSANIEETKIKKIKPGQDVDITIDALNGKKVIGKVEEIGKATLSTFSILPAQSSNGNFTKVTQLFPVKIRFPGSNQLGLEPGMSVEIKIHVAK